jgi:S-adenosylmethionine:tRNA ribosyltransferase-isomerase
MKISEFDYHLPEELIAQEPLPTRDASRMLVVNREERAWKDSTFSSFADCLNKGDVLVINNTRVFPARLFGEREPTGGRVEILLVKEIGPLVWEALIRPGGRLKEGDLLRFGESKLRAQIVNPPGEEMRRIHFNLSEELEAVLSTVGQMPLPPYIKRPQGGAKEDRERYQTVFARERGAIAAPTAGLHFTPQVLNEISQRGVSIAEITLHVGYGTFEPVRVEEVEEHKVRPEIFEITEVAADVINSARATGGRVVAVGTTTTRALESSCDANGLVQATRGSASLTITPGYEFKIVDALLTNFHLPQSSLLLLVSAFADSELILAAYNHAVKERYRFYSYGDCMLII